MRVSLYACRSASPESLSAHIVDIDTKTVTRAKTGARLAIGVACLPMHSLATSCYTSNAKLECRSAAGLCLEELHAINDAFGKHLEYENTKKRLTFFSFSLAIRKKKNNPVLNWLNVRFALLFHMSNSCVMELIKRKKNYTVGTATKRIALNVTKKV